MKTSPMGNMSVQMSVTRIAKASSAAKKMDNNWHDKKLALQIKRFHSHDNPPG